MSTRTGVDHVETVLLGPGIGPVFDAVGTGGYSLGIGNVRRDRPRLADDLCAFEGQDAI